MVVERVGPSPSFDRHMQMQNRQRGTQAQAPPSPPPPLPSRKTQPSTAEQQQQQQQLSVGSSPKMSPRRIAETQSSDPIRRPQMTSTSVDAAANEGSEDDQQQEQQQQRQQQQQRPPKRPILAKQQKQQQQQYGQPVKAEEVPTSAPTPPPRPSQQQQQQQPCQPVDLPPYPSPRLARGPTPIVELIDEPDELFFIVKELVLTERTYLRDLELAAVRLPALMMSLNAPRLGLGDTSDSDAEVTATSSLCSFASTTLHPLLNFHRAFAAELESRLCAWTASCSTGSHEVLRNNLLQIGDILMSLTTVLHLYRSYLARLLSLLWSPVVSGDLSAVFELLSRSCHSDLAAFYISPSLLLCRPAHRLLAYRHLLATYVAHLSPTHPDSLDASALLARLSDLLAGSSSVLSRVDSARIMLELRACLSPNRDDKSGQHLSIPLASTSEFVRLGCLHKLTRKGYQPRLFVLLSDSLLYAARLSSPTPGTAVFRLHSSIPVRELSLVGSNASLEAEPGRLQLVETSSGRRLHLVATSIGDWRRWVADLRSSISQASAGIASNSLPRRNRQFLDPPYQQQRQLSGESGASLSPPLRSSDPSTSPEVGRQASPRTAVSDLDPHHPNQDQSPQSSSQQPAVSSSSSGQGGVSLSHVCWHRALSVGIEDARLAGGGAQLSSYLLRKFKSAPGWQKLWVVLAADCALHFFKSCYDTTPLASLPLLGYLASPAQCPDDSPVTGASSSSLVFKLQFKSHVYLFRAESKYTYSRWLEAVRCATLAWWTAEQAGSDVDEQDGQVEECEADFDGVDFIDEGEKV